ncbi:hypothetical protein HXY33_08140 [Candidatus Bathyarchaeota archaeon]|nr:hypothetical protein [Candidatus Bathyarchaeota archaeon]
MQRAAVMEWFKHNSAKVFLLILILMAASVAAVFTYFGFFSPNTAPYASVESYPLKASIELNKSKFAVGEPVAILCKFENISNETITVIFPSGWQIYDPRDPPQNNYKPVYFTFIVTDANCTVVYRWGLNTGSSGSLVFCTMDPGAERSTLFYWYQETDYDYPEYAQVPSGEYQVKAVMPPNIGGVWINDVRGQNIRLETPSIPFTIR